IRARSSVEPSTSVNRMFAVAVANVSGPPSAPIVRPDYRASGKGGPPLSTRRRGRVMTPASAASYHASRRDTHRRPVGAGPEIGVGMPLFVIERNFAEQLDPETTDEAGIKA